MNIILRDYQANFYNNILNKLYNEGISKLVCVLPTGGGKSIIIGKLANELEGRTLILTHRIEILKQNSEWINNCGLLSSKINTLKYDNKVVIAMVQTLYARINKYGLKYIGSFNNIILDEIHILIFEKVFKQYNFNKLVGFTGTPTLNKKKYTTIDDIEYVEPYTLSELFDDLLQGPDSQDLIDLNYLVQDYNIVLKLPDFDKLKESDSSPDGYTKKSLNEVYTNTASLNILNKAYELHCKNKKVLIFNASTKINEFVFKLFKSKGLNVKMFDSVNAAEINPKTSNKFTREEIIDWFKNEKDAILINTNVFTTGFDVSDVEVVVVNRATKSLALWIQMVGRGSRTTTKTFKDKFTVIDLGQNIHQHGIWSKKRDWKSYFWSPGKRLKNQVDMLSTWECIECGSLNIKGEIICSICGADKENAIVTDGLKKKYKDGDLEIISSLPKPKAKQIINYTKQINENSNFAFKLTERKIIELFIHYKVTKEFYYNRQKRFKERIRQIYIPIYFAIIKSDLKGTRKKLDTQLDKLITKIEKIYK